MKLPIYYVGTPAEVEHHAQPLAADFDVRIEGAESVVDRARPGDVCIFYNEFFSRYRWAIHSLLEKGCATLYALDGIFEWRSLWEFPPGMSCLWSVRPVLSHKVACVGRSQARLLESWGNASQSEIVGVPRFDQLIGRAARARSSSEPFRILVLTAKAPGFTPQQFNNCVHSLRDLKSWLDEHSTINDVSIEAVWRLTPGLESLVGVENSLKDTTGKELAETLAGVDAMITTPSTAMLEGMLQQIPVALLDYNNCPHYVPAAWSITAANHLDQVVPELMASTPAKLLYQQHLLYDALECQSPAQPRLSELIVRMHEWAKRCRAVGQPISFPAQMLRRSSAELPACWARPNSAQLFPENQTFADRDLLRLQAQMPDLHEALAAATRDNILLKRKLSGAERSLHQLIADAGGAHLVWRWLQSAAQGKVRRWQIVSKCFMRKHSGETRGSAHPSISGPELAQNQSE